jgi:hypothetical protein
MDGSMNYFTPELLIELQECQSPVGFRAVNAKWELAVKQYGHELQELLPSLKGALRRFVKRGSLHDARVLDVGASEQSLTVVVQEELAPKLLCLTYALVEPPWIDRNALPEEHRTPQVLWLYDELDVDREMLFNPKRRVQERASAVPTETPDKEEWRPIFLHSILLSNGWEIRLRFHRFADARTTSLLRSGLLAVGDS